MDDILDFSLMSLGYQTNFAFILVTFLTLQIRSWLLLCWRKLSLTDIILENIQNYICKQCKAILAYS